MSNNLTNQTSTSAQGLSLRATRPVDDLECYWANQVHVDENGQHYLARACDGDARAILERRLHEIERLLMPWRGKQEEAKVMASVGKMLLGWDRGGDQTSTISAYCAVLNDLPLWAIQHACDLIARGQLTDINVDFRPSAARVHTAVAEVLLALHVERSQLSKILDAKPKDEQADAPDAHSRIVAGFKKLGEQLRGMSAPSNYAKRELAARDHRIIQRNDAEILAEWHAAGLEPVSYGDRPVSLTLAKQLGLIRTTDAREAV